jgi:LacI family transcriptional regulator
MAARDGQAVTLTELCVQADLRVPQDVAIVGVDNEDLLCEMGFPPVSSVEVGLRRIGHEAGRMLDAMMQGRTVEPSRILIPPVQVVTRGSSDWFPVSDERVESALRFIQDHAGEDMGVADVAAAVGVHRRVLEMIFRKCLNCTVHDRIRDRRLSLACQLLAETSEPVQAVARLSGFGSAQRMAVVFRSVTGATPTEYRERFRVK